MSIFECETKFVKAQEKEVKYVLDRLSGKIQEGAVGSSPTIYISWPMLVSLSKHEEAWTNKYGSSKTCWVCNTGTEDLKYLPNVIGACRTCRKNGSAQDFLWKVVKDDRVGSIVLALMPAKWLTQYTIDRLVTYIYPYRHGGDKKALRVFDGNS